MPKNKIKWQDALLKSTTVPDKEMRMKMKNMKKKKGKKKVKY